VAPAVGKASSPRAMQARPATTRIQW
jgi:hypothetical protein